MNAKRWHDVLRSPTGQRWIGWLGAVCVVTGFGALLLRALRQYPEGLHSYFASSPFLLSFLACQLTVLGVVALLFRLLSPRLSHLKLFTQYPPYWVAAVCAAILLALADWFIGLGPRQSDGAVWEWVVYVGISVAVMAACNWLTAPDELPPAPPPREESIEDLLRDWPRLECWLRSEVAAEDDLLGNQQVAQRLAAYLIQNGGTIGLVGPFGCGKTSVVKWIGDELKRRNEEPERQTQPTQPRVWLCEVNCWGFEDTASAIQQILSKAVKTVGQHADCFSIRNLPESYRKTFSAGGGWVRDLADLVIGTSDPMEQFQSLSDILKLLGARLVIVVEDLDRNNSTRFDRQEVLALLQRLKTKESLSFILTGGPTPRSGIDFARLCDRIELLREFEPRQVATIVQAVRERCLAGFQDIPTHSREDNPWDAGRSLLLYWDILPLSHALARLLTTPRALKHALRRTYQAWERLHGEIDFDHLFGVNILRSAAPDAFDFVWRNWSHLHQPSRLQREDREQRNRVRTRLREEWTHLTDDAEWDRRALETLLEFLLPQSAQYFGEDDSRHVSGQTRLQGVTEPRYWLRAVNEEIEPQHVRDQVVIAEMRGWLADRNPNGQLVDGLIREEDYAGRWEHFSTGGEWDGPTLLCLSAAVLARFRDQLGSRRTVGEVPHFPPFAFGVLWRQASRRVRHDEASLLWLEEQIRLAMPSSLMLVVDLYYYWASTRNGIIRNEDRGRIRRLVLQLAREYLRSVEDLIRVCHPEPYDLYQLVFPPGDEEDGPSECRGPEHWTWLGPIILYALGREPRLFAPKVAGLISDRRPRRTHRDRGVRDPPGAIAGDVRRAIR